MKIYNTLKNKIFDRLWFKITCFCSMPLFIFMCILYLEYMNYRSVRRVFQLWDKHPDSLILAFIVTAMISVILLLLARRLWIYATVMGAAHADNRDNKLRKAGGKRRLFFPVGYINGKKYGAAHQLCPL